MAVAYSGILVVVGIEVYSGEGAFFLVVDLALEGVGGDVQEGDVLGGSWLCASCLVFFL